MQSGQVLLAEENKVLKAEIERLNGIILLLKRSKYGPQSERVEEIPPDQMIFNEFEKESKSPLISEERETITYTRKKGRRKKKPFPEDLEREVVYNELPEEEKHCPHHGKELKYIGDEVTEKLVTHPARMFIREEHTKKYVFDCCESPPKQAKVNSILPKTIATPELLSFIIFSKFFQALPLYRLEELFALRGIELSRGRMARWMVQVSEKLMPIWNVLEEKVLGDSYMAIDATSVQVLKEKGRAPETKSFMWARGSPEKEIVLFDYNTSGGGKVASRLVSGFKGALQADAHKGYNAIDKEHLLLLGCMMHARRRFHKAYIIGKKKPGLAADGLALLKRLYDLEDKYKENGLRADERYQARLKEVKPLLGYMKGWAEEKKNIVLPSTPIGNAISYFINEYDELTAFLQNGRYEIDNGWLERVIRKFAIGRNNWMFCDTVEGANASSLLYSLVITAKLNGKDPFIVMTEIFKRLPLAKTIDDYEELAGLLLKKEGERCLTLKHYQLPQMNTTH